MNLRFLILLPLGWLVLNSTLIAQIQHPPTEEVFRDDVVARIDLFLSADSLNWLVHPDNSENDEYLRAMFVFDNGTVLDTLEDVGLRLRGNFSRNAGKKPFKVSFDRFVPGREFYDLERMNLNSQHNDPSVSRAKLCAELSQFLNLPTARTNHVRLYINGNYRGLYTNVEHIDEEFVYKRYGNKSGNLYKCLWPGDLNYKGADPDLYKEYFWGRQAYELKTNEAADDYSDLANFIDILNNTSPGNLPCELEKVFNVDQYLRTMVFDILSGNWDGHSYNKNNFYLYHNRATNRFEYIPYDLDNTWGIDWLGEDWGTRDIYTWSHPTEDRPLYTRIMDHDVYRDRFSYYMDQCLNQFFNQTHLYPLLDNLESQLLSHLQNDPFYPLDYGYTPTSFQNSFDMALPDNHTDYGLKPFISTRRGSTQGQLILNDIDPVIQWSETNNPAENQPIIARAHIWDDGNLDSVFFCFFQDMPSNTSCVQMFDDGNHHDGTAGDGIFGVEIPALGETGLVDYYISVRDDIGQESRKPICDYEQFWVGPETPTLALNEIMASNNSTHADEQGEYDDWVEIYNYGTEAVYLGDKYLSDDESTPDKWMLPDYHIQADEYILIWADNDPNQGPFHANFKLKASGEYIGIFDNATNNFSTIDELAFSTQISDQSFGRIPNGTGIWQNIPSSPAASNMASSIESQLETLGEVSLFPNPFSQSVYLQWSKSLSSSAKVEILDGLGRPVFDQKLSEGSQSLEINTIHLSAGFYVLSISLEGKRVYQRKLLKQD